jgi:PAS domain-containing protein
MTDTTAPGADRPLPGPAAPVVPVPAAPAPTAGPHADAGSRAVGDGAAGNAALGASEAQYRTVFDAIDEGFCIIERVETAPGAPLDFRYLETNPAFERHAGLSGVVGRTLREVVPGVESEVVALYDRVATTGVAARREVRVAALDRWIEVHVSRVGAPELPRVAVVLYVVSAR